MRISVAIVIVLACGSSHARADELIYGSSGLFRWTESNGAIEETGVRYALGANSKHALGRQFDQIISAEVFWVDADYEGRSQDGDPARSETTYFGMRFETDTHAKLLRGDRGELRVLAGVGFARWTRNIENTLATVGPGEPAMLVAGYREDWHDLYARAGLSGGVRISKRATLELAAGLRYSLLTQNRAHLAFATASGEDVTVHPEARVGWFASVGYVPTGKRRIGARVGYRLDRFARSDASQGFVQPKSESGVYALDVGGVF